MPISSTYPSQQNSYLSVSDELFLYQIELKFSEWSKGNDVSINQIDLFTGFIKRLLQQLNVSEKTIESIKPLCNIRLQNFINGIYEVNELKKLNSLTRIESCFNILSLLSGAKQTILNLQSKL
jgi:hypothetical protein